MVNILAELSGPVKMGLICGAIGGGIGAIVGLINWAVRRDKKK